MGALDGKAAIVTGGGSGIGRAMALGLASEGASVAVTDIDPERAQAVADEIGDAAFGLMVDVTQTAAVDNMVRECVERFGGVDILINNAGRVEVGDVADVTDEQWDAVVATNMRGTFACSRAAVREMLKSGWGRIVNVASGRGVYGSPHLAVYGATKAAIINFTRSFAQEVAGQGITVNAIGPGPTDTPFWRRGRTEEQIEAAVASGRVGRPEDFVPMVLFLCSDAGAQYTGLMIDRELFTQQPNA